MGGDLGLVGNGALVGIEEAQGLEAVGGDVAVTDNGALATSVVEAWLAGVAVTGTVTVSGNRE
ncbi:MAG: hypothetical protein R3F59_06645 [Myxococcota bacterium]